jgi:hypothetical protein
MKSNVCEIHGKGYALASKPDFILCVWTLAGGGLAVSVTVLYCTHNVLYCTAMYCTLLLISKFAGSNNSTVGTGFATSEGGETAGKRNEKDSVIGRQSTSEIGASGGTGSQPQTCLS